MLRKENYKPSLDSSGKTEAKTTGFRIFTWIGGFFYYDCDRDHDTERKNAYLGS